MGAAELDNSQLRKHVHIETWAQEMKTKHTRECIEKYCGGKSKIWWLVRHPKVSPNIATDVTKTFAREKYHCCEVLLEKLESGLIPWLPKERQEYASRDDDLIMALLGRENPDAVVSKKVSESADDLKNPFPGVRESFPRATREIPRAPRETPAQYPGRSVGRQPYEPQSETYRNGRRVNGPHSGLGQAIDALTRRE